MNLSRLDIEQAILMRAAKKHGLVGMPNVTIFVSGDKIDARIETGPEVTGEVTWFIVPDEDKPYQEVSKK